MAIEGLTTVASSLSPKETMDRFVAAATAAALLAHMPALDELVIQKSMRRR
jgi:hypothetical protein